MSDAAFFVSACFSTKQPKPYTTVALPQEPMTLCQTLLPRGVDGSKGSLLQYEIIVYTSDIRGAGTDADIFVEMHGRRCAIDR